VPCHCRAACTDPVCRYVQVSTRKPGTLVNSGTLWVTTDPSKEVARSCCGRALVEAVVRQPETPQREAIGIVAGHYDYD